MPIYEYRCLKCEQRFEILVRKKPEPTDCKTCDGKLQRLISLPAKHAAPPSDSDIAASGLTKLKKTSDGKYERVAGPKVEGISDITVD